MDSFWIAARVIVPMALTVGIGVLLRVFHITDKPGGHRRAAAGVSYNGQAHHEAGG